MRCVGEPGSPGAYLSPPVRRLPVAPSASVLRRAGVEIGRSRVSGATTSLLAPNALGYCADTVVGELRRTLAAIPAPADAEEQDQAEAVVG